MTEALLNVQTQWVYVFKSMFENGDVARMGGNTFLVYTALKCFSELSSGKNSPTISQIIKYTGLSERTVQASLSTLEKMSYLRVVKRDGKANEYVPVDRFDYTNPETGEIEARAQSDYIPAMMREVVKELKNFSVTANSEGARTIHIETINLTVNVQNNGRDGNIANNYLTKTPDPNVIADPGIRAIATQISEKRAKAKGEK